MRRLSRERISDELKSCAELGYTDLIFYDDCLFIRSPRLNHRVLEFCDAAESSGWRGTYQMELRCDAVVSLSDEALRALTATGCRQINMGIEKAHTSRLALLEKRLTPDVAREACERLSSSGIRGAGTFILGGVEESPRILEETVEFALSLPSTSLTLIRSLCIQALPCTSRCFQDRHQIAGCFRVSTQNWHLGGISCGAVANYR